MLTAKQKRFGDEYLVDCNATQAAIRAGYSKDTAYSIGWENLRKPEIKQYIDTKLEEMSLGPNEAKKLISDIAKSSLNDYFTIKQVEHMPRVKKPLKLLIAQLQREIKFEDEFAAAAKLNKEQKDLHKLAQEERRLQIIRYQLELKYNPKAYRIVNGDPVLVDAAELDMVKLVHDKANGRIKSISHTPHGPKVEMYAADTALRDVAKMHNLFKEDEEEKAINITINGKGVKVN